MASAYQKRFKELVDQPIESQLEFFLKRYIFTLGEDWKKVADLANKFTSYSDSKNASDLNIVEAADFLQKNGKTRTAQERKAELKDIDLDNNNRIAFLEYLLLHYKVMVLKDFFASKGKSVPADMDLSNDGVGVTGVGEIILEALFTFGGLDPKIEAAIDEVMKERKTREDTMHSLQKTIEDTTKSQVERMKCQHELLRMEREDTSGADVALIHLMASKRRVAKNGKDGKEHEKALLEEKKAEDADKAAKAKASKNKLGGMLQSFQKNAQEKTDPNKFVGKGNDRASIKAIRSGGLNLYTEAARKSI